MKTYGATSPEQVAALFDMRAAIAEKAVFEQGSKIHATKLQTEATTWREAAAMIRDIEFVNWKSIEQKD
jgi:hypothetical protein